MPGDDWFVSGPALLLSKSMGGPGRLEARMEQKAKGSIGVFLAEDHHLVRQAIALLLESASDIAVIGQAGDGLHTVERVGRLRPDVVLMDVDLPGISGIEATRRVVQQALGVSVIVLTMYDREDLLTRALEAGARGYVLKAAGADDLLMAIRAVHAGQVFICPEMARKLVDGYLRRADGASTARDRYQNLSAREAQVLPMLAEGLAIQDIAGTLHLSPHTVRTYRQRIMQKLGVHSATELLLYSLRTGLTRLGP